MKRLALLTLLGIMGYSGVAQAASALEKNFWLSGPNYSGRIPACDDPSVQERIRGRFANRESTFWNSSLKIDKIDRTTEIAFRPWGEDYIPRRFCSARTFTSDGHKRGLYYYIAEDQGIIGATWGVTWCVTGLDRNHAFAPDCKMTRP